MSTREKLQLFFQTGEWKLKKRELENNSEDIENWLDKFIAEYKSVELDFIMINNYFAQNKSYFYYHPKLTQFLFNLSPAEFIRYLKFYEIFRQKWFEHFIEPIKDKQEIKDLREQIRLFTNYENKILKLKNELSQRLKGIDFIDLIVNLVIWQDYEILEVLKNEHTVFNLRPNVALTVSLLVNLKPKQVTDQKKEINPTDVQQKLIEFQQDSELWNKFIEEFIKPALQIVQFNNLKDTFIKQNWRFIKLGENYQTVLPNSEKDEKIWQINEQLQDYINTYLTKKEFFDRIPITINSAFFNGIPPRFKIDDKELNIAIFFEFFDRLRALIKYNYYERFLQIAKEYFYSGKFNQTTNFEIISKTLESGNLWYKPMMGSLNIVSDVEELLNNTKTFQINKAQITTILENIIYDTENALQQDFYILEKPFIKYSDKIFFYGAPIYFNKSIFVLNSVFDVENKELESIAADQFEQNIADLLKLYGFNVKVGVKLGKKEKQLITDIDVLAWSGDEILIIQAKRTNIRITAGAIEQYSQRQFIKAAEQIDKSINYIKGNFDEFLKKNDIELTTRNPKIFGLIISNTYEGNFKTYGKNKYPKISLAELDIILSDKKEWIYDWDLEALSYLLKSKDLAKKYKSVAGEFLLIAKVIYEEELKAKLSDLRIWQDNEISISKLIEIIKKNLLWEDVIEDKDLEIVTANEERNKLKSYLLFSEAKAIFDYAMELKKQEKFIKEKFEEAKNILSKAYKLNPKDKDIQMYYADALAEIGAKEKAIKIYSSVISNYPDYPTAYYNRALTYLELSNKYPSYIKKAYQDFCSVLKYDYANPYAYSNARRLQQQKQFKNCIKKTNFIDFKIREKLEKRLNPLNFNQINDSDDLHLSSILHRIYELNDFRAIKEFLNDLLRKKAYNEALTFIEDYQKQNPNHLNSKKLEASKIWILKELKRQDKAEEICKNLFIKNCKESEIWRTCAELNLEEDYVEVEKFLLKAIELDPKNYYAHYDLGLIYEKKGLIDKAIAEIEVATQTSFPEWKQTFYYKLYEIYLSQNNILKARESLKEAIKYGYFEGIWQWLEINRKYQDELSLEQYNNMLMINF